MAKLWAGRFKKEEDKRVNDFNSSIRFDYRMYKHDILGSIAHATMLGNQGIIEKSESEQIIKGLESILEDLENKTLEFDPEAEDLHMFVEEELTKRLGDTGKRLHTSRSRNDQVALDIRLYLKDDTDEVIALIKDLLKVLCNLSLEHKDTIMSGYTHLQRAQPVTFGHHLMAYAQMLLRDIGRFEDAKRRMDESPLGSCALAGTTYPIDREAVAKSLGLSCATQNSLDGVSDRDFCVELLNAVALLMTHLSRFCEEIIMWCSWEFKFIELDDAYATGSSIMPQKKNPDIAELIRGKTGRVIGDLVTMLTVLKGLPLAYNKDMQEDKEAVFDAFDTVKLCLTTFTPMLSTMTVLKDNMRKAAAKGFINATDCADYLVKKGVPFRDAYKITGSLVALCIEKDQVLETLPIDDYKKASEVFDDDIYKAIDLDKCVAERKVKGSPCPQNVESQVKYVLSKL